LIYFPTRLLSCDCTTVTHIQSVYCQPPIVVDNTTGHHHLHIYIARSSSSFALSPHPPWLTQYRHRPKTRSPWTTSFSFLSQERWSATWPEKQNKSSDAMCRKHHLPCRLHQEPLHKAPKPSQLYLRLKHSSRRWLNDLTCKYQP